MLREVSRRLVNTDQTGQHRQNDCITSTRWKGVAEVKQSGGQCS